MGPPNLLDCSLYLSLFLPYLFPPSLGMNADAARAILLLPREMLLLFPLPKCGTHEVYAQCYYSLQTVLR